MTAPGKPVGAPERNEPGGVCPIEEIIADFNQGRMVIMVDDEDRENEGDLLVAAERVRAEDINFMAQHGRGLICLTLTEERCRQLALPLMVRDNNAHYSTNFTVSIEAARGVTTGISAADRATTVRTAVRPGASADDLVSPGHVFPIMAQAGGVLTRAGHTEAGIDLARLAGFEPASVICEILKDDGSMARFPDLLRFGQQHGIRIGTIADLIRYRLAHEPTVQRLTETELSTASGTFRVVAFRDMVDGEIHFAFVTGEIARATPVLVRVHVFTGLYDALAEARGDQAWPLAETLARLAGAGAGVLVVLRHEQGAEALLDRLRSKHIQDMGIESVTDVPSPDLRMLGVGSQILADLGVGKMRVMGTPKKVHGLSGFGLEIVEYVGTSER